MFRIDAVSAEVIAPAFLSACQRRYIRLGGFDGRHDELVELFAPRLSLLEECIAHGVQFLFERRQLRRTIRYARSVAIHPLRVGRSSGSVGRLRRMRAAVTV